MSEVDVYKSRLERTVKIQLASEGRPYGRKDVRDGLLKAGVPRKAIEALERRPRAERRVGGHVVYGGGPQLPPSAPGHRRQGPPSPSRWRQEVDTSSAGVLPAVLRADHGHHQPAGPKGREGHQDLPGERSRDWPGPILTRLQARTCLEI